MFRVFFGSAERNFLWLWCVDSNTIVLYCPWCLCFCSRSCCCTFSMVPPKIANFVWPQTGHITLELLSVSAMFAQTTRSISMPVWTMMYWVVPFWPVGTINTVIIVVVDVFRWMISMKWNTEWSVVHCGSIDAGRGTHSFPWHRILFRFWMLVSHSIFENRFQAMQILSKSNLCEFRINLINIERRAAITIIIAEC